MSENRWSSHNVVAGLIQNDDQGISWIAVPDKDIPEAYWEKYQAAWWVDGVAPKLNDGACTKGTISNRLVWLPYVVYLSLCTDNLGPEYGEVCL